ncbi:Bax inhibitor-1/YccA family protein [Marinagarivorans cellulosilyticus]|uniref:Modulator of FtsH protease n=1 Tax=Marinagarivorans cellulosilyticus TaxID=2721545 RepID=A0AAN1WHD5_9GAMM|nr:Bax inhibitor-1/YccA family protein [Marinagarivorans cellulosilyticus]BCD97633.1 modulator of FtsH protease [Marinagarivorans cellulosilyticus]
MQQVYSASSIQNAETHKVLRNTYSLLAVTMLVSAISAFVGMAIGLSHIISIAFSFGAIGLIWFVLPKVANSPKGILVVFAVAALMGAGLAPTISYYLQSANGGMIVMQALGGTALVFFALSGYVLTTRKDFSFMGGFLMVGLITVVVAGLAFMVLGMFGIHMPAMSLALSAVVVLLMSGFILYDTSAIIHGGETNYIMATIRLYLDILNLFTALLHILGVMNDD